MKELPKAYEPKKYEDDIYKKWEESGFFNPDVCVEKKVTDANAPHFSIVLPPPNVTGTLHMGHAAMLAIEDVMVRYHRMKGDRTLWVPGTDHAAVATESKVEAKLIKEEGLKKPKEELGREEFLKRVNQFAQESHDTIVNQCKKMGASLDWSREAYTLDEQRSLAVRTVFKKMYDDGLIYRGYRVINWSVKGQSTCSDDELVHVERPAKLYYFKYSKDFPITIATTRPETKLGDTAVAVNPKDERYKKYIGQEFTVDVGAAQPLKIKIIANEEVDPEFGTGALGVTPAHSAVDFEMYVKQKEKGEPIELIQVIGEDGRMTAVAGKNYEGLKVEEAREKFVEYLREQNLLEKEEDITQNVGTSDRFGDVVEALPKTQWFVDVNKKFKIQNTKLKNIEAGQEVSLKELMQSVVRDQEIKIIPERFEKTYFHWIDNLRDWCISRQIWFGHAVPAYYDILSEGNSECLLHFTNGPVFDMSDEEFKELEKQDSNCYWGSANGIRVIDFRMARLLVKNGLSWKELKNHIFWMNLSKANDIKPFIDESEVPESAIVDSDTLDTWFSSGLWTFSTLGWPNNLNDLQKFHPTSVLETGYDILFFWVARMILMTTYTLGEVPFKTVYLHGLVRDEQGRKMSKSLGNIINPLDMIEKYGTDATRLSLLLGNTPGNDMKLSEEKIAGFRNFTNKLWNISRFVLMNIENPEMNIKVPEAQTLSDKRILQQLSGIIEETTLHLEEFRLSLAGEKLYSFIWDEFADRYIENAKIEKNKDNILNFVLNTILKLCHPLMPFVTEAIWEEVYGKDQILMVEKWPKIFELEYSDEDISKSYEMIEDLIRGLNNARSQYKVNPTKKLNAFIEAGDRTNIILANDEVIKGRANLEKVDDESLVQKFENGQAYRVIDAMGFRFYLDLAELIDKDKERTRLLKEIDQIQGFVDILKKRLENKEMLEKATSAYVAKTREQYQGYNEKLNELKIELARIEKI